MVFTYAAPYMNFARIHIFAFLLKQHYIFVVVCHIVILSLLSVNSWNFGTKYFDLFLFLSQKRNSIKMKGFCFLTKQGGIIFELSKRLISLPKFVYDIKALLS